MDGRKTALNDFWYDYDILEAARFGKETEKHLYYSWEEIIRLTLPKSSDFFTGTSKR